MLMPLCIGGMFVFNLIFIIHIELVIPSFTRLASTRLFISFVLLILSVKLLEDWKRKAMRDLVMLFIYKMCKRTHSITYIISIYSTIWSSVF